jgi:hypothetical protein
LGLPLDDFCISPGDGSFARKAHAAGAWTVLAALLERALVDAWRYVVILLELSRISWRFYGDFMGDEWDVMMISCFFVTRGGQVSWIEPMNMICHGIYNEL